MSAGVDLTLRCSMPEIAEVTMYTVALNESTVTDAERAAARDLAGAALLAALERKATATDAD